MQNIISLVIFVAITGCESNYEQIEVDGSAEQAWKPAAGPLQCESIDLVSGYLACYNANVETVWAVDTTPYVVIPRSNDALETTFYRDFDRDGYGDLNSPLMAVTQPFGYVVLSTDCWDTYKDVHPMALEIDGDGIDSNCDVRQFPDSNPQAGTWKFRLDWAAAKMSLDAFVVTNLTTGQIGHDFLRHEDGSISIKIDTEAGDVLGVQCKLGDDDSCVSPNQRSRFASITGPAGQYSNNDCFSGDQLRCTVR